MPKSSNETTCSFAIAVETTVDEVRIAHGQPEQPNDESELRVCVYGEVKVSAPQRSCHKSSCSSASVVETTLVKVQLAHEESEQSSDGWTP